MIIKRATLEDCHKDTDTAIAIDVIRAFTTSAFAFSQGAREIALVSTIEDAFELKACFPKALTMGEDRGHPVEGFDFGNSPTLLLDQDLRGKRLIQRTSAGTQGVVRSRARNILTTGLCTLSATIQLVRKLQPDSITLIQTGVLADGWGDEDVACADLIESQLCGSIIDIDEIKARVRDSYDGRLFTIPDHFAFPSADLEAALEIDRFDFAMMVHNDHGVLILRKEPIPSY
jgi:2-phosphosulfolactate phosphatase